LGRSLAKLAIPVGTLVAFAFLYKTALSAVLPAL